MKIIHPSDGNKVIPTASTIIYEFTNIAKNISGATSHIDGRYPEQGFALNEVSHEVVYVVRGTGHLLSPQKTISFSTGDVIYIDRNEPFAWKGNCTFFIATAPAFEPKQHKVVTK